MPRTGGALLVVNHSLATYDAFLLGDLVFEATGRIPAALADDLFFKLPPLARAARAAGLHPGSPAAGERLLRDGHLVVVAPGGMREGLRPSSEKYQVRWDRRRGFVRLAIAANVPIVLAACPAADDLYSVYENRLTKLLYNRWRVPVPLVRGRGLSLLPRPTRLVHLVDAPIYPGPDADVDQLHAQVTARMNALLRTASSL